MMRGLSNGDFEMRFGRVIPERAPVLRGDLSL